MHYTNSAWTNNGAIYVMDKYAINILINYDLTNNKETV